MFKKNASVAYFPIGRFVSTTDGTEVTTGTPTGTYSKDGTEGTLSGTIAYKSTAKEWGITGLTGTEMNGDVIGLNFTLAGAVPIHYTIRTTTKLVSELVDAPAVATDGSLQVTLKSGTHTGAVIPTVTTVGTLTTYTGNTPQTGDSFARIGVAGAGLTALGDTRIANLDAAVSTRSTYAGGDTAGTTTLLSRLTSGRATLLDNLDAAISTRSTYAGADTSGTTTLLSRLTSGRAALLDNLDAAVTSRMATFAYTAPPTAAAIATAVWTTTTASDFATASSPGKILATQLGGAFTTTASSVFTTASLANAPSGGGGGGGGGVTLAELQDELDTRYVTTTNISAMAATLAGNLTENASHTTSSFTDIGGSTPRVTSVQTATTRTVTVN